MASLITHALVPVGFALASGPSVFNARLLGAACIVTLLADADVIAFSFGIPYESPFGHRGFTHSVVFALAVGVIAALAAQALQRPARSVFVVISVAALSHPLLDSFTNGGLGVALAWPFSGARWFAPWRPIEVSPIGLDSFFSARGLAVLGSEVVWVWLPLFVAALLLRRRRLAQATRP